MRARAEHDFNRDARHPIVGHFLPIGRERGELTGLRSDIADFPNLRVAELELMLG
jgi:hypothetical protein